MEVVVEEVLWRDDGEEAARFEEFCGAVQKEEFAAPVLTTRVKRQIIWGISENQVDEGAGVVPGQVLVRKVGCRVEVLGDREGVCVYVAAVEGCF